MQKNHMMKKRCISFILLISFFVCLLFEQKCLVYASSEIEGFICADENDHLALYYSKDSARILVINKNTGYIWDSAYGCSADDAEWTTLQQEEMKSLLSLTCTSVTKFSSKTVVDSLENLDYELEIEKRKKGFVYKIQIEKYDCEIAVEYVLGEDGLKVSIPENGIRETIKAEKTVATSSKEIEKTLRKLETKLQNKLQSGNSSSQVKNDTNKALIKIDEMIKSIEETKGPNGISDVCDTWSKSVDEINTLTKEISGTKSDVMKLKIQIAKLQNLSAYAVVKIDVMPYFGACGDQDEGYMIYPDGSGSLTYFKQNHGQFSSCYQADTYTDRVLDLDWEMERKQYGISSQTVPYFGVKNGENGWIAYVSEGQGLSDVSFRPSGYLLNVNRIGCGFSYRQIVATSSVNGEWQSGSDTQVYEQEMEHKEVSIQYMFLENEDANYSGMARRLRSYLENHGMLSTSNLVKEKQVPLALEVLGGYTDQILSYKKRYQATTVEELSEIVNQYADVPVLCNYLGVYEEGFDSYPTKYKINSKLGTEETLNKLSASLQERKGKLFLSGNQLRVDLSENGYSKGDLAINNQFQLLVSQSDDDAISLFSPQKVEERMEKMVLPAFMALNGIGISEEMMGATIYNDYAGGNKFSRSDTVELWKKCLEQEKNVAGAISVEGGNDYVFATADWIRNVSEDSDGYRFTDEAIPFYEMLVHGKKICTALPNNQYYNEKKQVLHAIEYGLVPYFSLVSDQADVSKIPVYASRSSEIYERIVDIYNQYNEALFGLQDVSIKEHKKKGDLVTVIYENGSRIYINYSEHKKKIDGKTVEAMSFVRVDDKEIEASEQRKELQKEKINIETKRRNAGLSVYSTLVIGVFAILSISIALFCGFSLFKHRRS